MKQQHVVALFGFGNIGKGVGEILVKNGEEIFEKTGKKIIVKKICLKSLANIPEDTFLPKEIFTDNPKEIFEDAEIETIIELIGGTDVAKDRIEQALESKKNVVSANKAIIAEFGEELLQKAEKNGVRMLCEASVAGGIPILRTLRTHFPAGKIQKISGILNGTCNFLLSELEKGGKNYDEVLREAQKKGFAEADPTFDVEGMDATQKLVLLSALAFSTEIPNWKTVARTGISNLKKDDFIFAKEHGKVIRLVGRAEEVDGKLRLGVHPRLVDKNSILGKTVGPENVVVVEHEFLGTLSLLGAGAGRFPTAVSVISDILEMAGEKNSPTFASKTRKKFVSAAREEVKKSMYVRVFVKDEVGVLAQMAKIFAEEGISIHLLSNATNEKPMCFVLHEASIVAVENATERISKLPCVLDSPVLLPVE